MAKGEPEPPREAGMTDEYSDPVLQIIAFERDYERRRYPTANGDAINALTRLEQHYRAAKQTGWGFPKGEAPPRDGKETMTWTVSSDDLTVNRYTLSGDTMTPQSERQGQAPAIELLRQFRNEQGLTCDCGGATDEWLGRVEALLAEGPKADAPAEPPREAGNGYDPLSMEYIVNGERIARSEVLALGKQLQAGYRNGAAPTAEPPSEDETELWGMVERRALTDPVLRMAVTHVHRGDCGKVEALARVVLFLSTERARWMAEEVARLNNSVGMGRF